MEHANNSFLSTYINYSSVYKFQLIVIYLVHFISFGIHCSVAKTTATE